jgi:hypothetical protein
MLILAIDQFGVRIGAGICMWTVCKFLVMSAEKNQSEQHILVELLCSEELTDIRIAQEKERIKKQLEMVVSPPRKKTNSPSRVPKAIALST